MDKTQHVPLPDLTRTPLAEIRAHKGAALDRALRQAIASLDDPNGVISAFQSFIGD